MAFKTTKSISRLLFCVIVFDCYVLQVNAAIESDSLDKFVLVDGIHLGLDILNTSVFLGCYSSFSKINLHGSVNTDPHIITGTISYIGSFIIETSLEIIAWKHYKRHRTYELIVSHLCTGTNFSKYFSNNDNILRPEYETDWMNQSNQFMAGIQTEVIIWGNIGSSSKFIHTKQSSGQSRFGRIIYGSHSYYYKLDIIATKQLSVHLKPAIEFGLLSNSFSELNESKTAFVNSHSLESFLIGLGGTLNFMVGKYISISLYDAPMYGPIIVDWHPATSGLPNNTDELYNNWILYNQLTLGLGITF